MKNSGCLQHSRKINDHRIYAHQQFEPAANQIPRIFGAGTWAQTFTLEDLQEMISDLSFKLLIG